MDDWFSRAEVLDADALSDAIIDDDLQTALLAIEGARDHADGCTATLDALAAEVATVRDETSDGFMALAAVLGTRRDFRGDPDHYRRPENSHLTKVLSNHRGLPVLLCCVWLLVARRVGVPIVGIALPGHFVLRDEESRRYADPFEGGRILTAMQCLELSARASGEVPSAEMVTPCSLSNIVPRVLRNWVNHHTDVDDPRGAYRAARILAAIRPDDPEPQFLVAQVALNARGPNAAAEVYEGIAERLGSSSAGELARRRATALRQRRDVLH